MTRMRESFFENESQEHLSVYSFAIPVNCCHLDATAIVPRRILARTKRSTVKCGNGPSIPLNRPEAALCVGGVRRARRSTAGSVTLSVRSTRDSAGRLARAYDSAGRLAEHSIMPDGWQEPSIPPKRRAANASKSRRRPSRPSQGRLHKARLVILS